MKKVEYVSMRTLKQTLPYLTVTLTILYAFMRIYKSYNPFAFPGIEERISLILVPCLFLTLIFYFPFQRIANLLKVTLNILREKVPMPKPTFIQKRAWFNVFKLKFTEKFDFRKIISSENYQKALIKYLFLVFLIIIALLELEPVSNYLSFLASFKTHLFVLAIVFGVVTFWQNKEVIDKVEEEIAEEQKQEEKRKAEFTKKYPGINKIPLIRNFVRWMYKEGWRYSITLFLIVLVGFGLRVTNLTYLEPYTDEYAHLVGAKAINDHGSPTFFIDGKMTEPYTRTYSLTVLISVLFSFFGTSLFIARLPGVMFGTLAIIPFYFIGRKINKNIGLISSVLWMCSPWAIAVSRNVREYAIFPFFFLVIFLFLLKFYDYIVKILKKDKFRINLKMILYLLGAIIPIIYGFYINPASSFKQIAILYGVFFIFLIYYIFRSQSIKSQTKKIVGGISLFLVLLSSFIYFIIDIDFVDKFPKFNHYWLNLILGNSSTQWSYNAGIYGFYVIFAFGVIFSLYSLLKNRFEVAGFIFLTFITYFYFFIFHFSRYIRPRYEFGILLWLIPIIAIGLYLLFKIFTHKLNNIKQGIILLTLLIIIILSVFNPANTYQSFNIYKHGYVPITNECHDKYLPVLEKYDKYINENDTIICSLCGPLYWYGQVNVTKNNVYSYTYSNESRFAKTEEIITNSDKGWMILDWRRNNRWTKGYPKKDFMVGNKNIPFLEVYSGFYIYKWGNETDYQ